VLEKQTSRNLNKLCFLDSLHGWVVGDTGTVLRTTNGGENWTLQQTGITNDILDICMVDQKFGWAVAIDLITYGTVTLKTTNGGSVWRIKRYPIPEKYFYTVEFLDSLTGWMGGAGVLVKTTDGGETWSDASVDSTMYSNFPIRNLKFFSRNYAFGVGGAMDITAVVWKTTNRGERWSVTGISSEPLNDLYYIDSLNIVCIGGDFEYGADLVSTTNGGEDWEYRYLAIFGEGRAISFRTRAEAWVALGFTGTYMYTLDSGRTWTDMFTPDSSGVYDVVFTDPSHGFMVGKRGTILRYNPQAVSVNASRRPEIPSTTTLAQNYPNPFNPTTTIQYDLPEKSYVTIKIHDIVGREVETINVGIKQAGTHGVRFSGMRIASGVYLYTLSVRPLVSKAAEYSLTRKMVLIR
jgi:photosystem II stability/assembly factor-like uncharacterized protein